MILLFDTKLTRTVDSLRKSGESRTDVIQCAIALLKVAVEAEANGESLHIVHKDGTETRIIMK